MSTLTHDQLQHLAVRLLKGRTRRLPLVGNGTRRAVHVGGCAVVAAEVEAWEEVPDAIGWDSAGQSTLIECKTSRADFRRGLYKRSRRNPGTGAGTYRYYLTPPGLVHPTELPAGWGLLEAHHATYLTRIRAAAEATALPTSRRKEMACLIRLMRLASGKCDHRIGAAFAFVQPWPDTDPRRAHPFVHEDFGHEDDEDAQP